ncbi:hypothetical protein ACROYT_G015249 [Oculina patagonica]
MVVKNFFVEMSINVEIEKNDKVFCVTVFPKVLTAFLKEDIFKYREDTDSLEVKLLTLENMDFNLNQTGKMVKQILPHSGSREQQVDCNDAQDEKSENSESTLQEACDVTLQELQKMAPNQEVNVCATMSMGTKEPKKIEAKYGQTLTVKEDCILEDGSTTMEIHIWEPLFAQLTDKKAYHFKNLTL